MAYSGLTTITTKVNDQLVDVEAGVKAYYPIEKDKFFDRAYLTSQIKTLIK